MLALSLRFVKLTVISVLLTLTSCVKDVDVEQAEDIVIQPVVDLNLVFFNLEGQRFYDLNTNLPIPTIRDTTEIRFLDDQDIAESLRRVEFLTRYANSVPREFTIAYRFLSEQNDTTYTFVDRVPMGMVGDTTAVEFLEVIEGDGVAQLTMANRLVVEVNIDAAAPLLPGSLQAESATTYFLEITERE